MWRTWTRNFSRNTWGLPNAAFASRAARAGGLFELLHAFDDAHPAAAAAVRRLHDHRGVRLTEHPCLLERIGRVEVDRQSGHRGHTHALRHLLRRDLVAERLDDVRARPDERDAARATRCGERRILREESVARVDRVDPGTLRDVQDLVDREVRIDRLPPLADEIRLVGLVAVLMRRVLLAEDRHRLAAELGACAEDADRDFAAVRAEDLVEALDLHESVSRAGLRSAARGVSERSITRLEAASSKVVRARRETGEKGVFHAAPAAPCCG
jgi:hypothetical protein